jgi:hypothetical protein
VKLVLAAVCASVVGCGAYRIDPADYRVVPRPPPTGYAQVRFVNAITAYPPDIYLRDVTPALISNLGFGNAEGYFELAAQPYTLDVRVGGTSRSGDPVYTQNVALADRSRSTMFYCDGPAFYPLDGDLSRVDPGLLKVFNASPYAVSFDFGADGSFEVSDLAPFADARATLPTLAETRLTVTADGDPVRENVELPERPVEGDIVIAVMPDATVKLLTYSFVVDDL